MSRVRSRDIPPTTLTFVETDEPGAKRLREQGMEEVPVFPGEGIRLGEAADVNQGALIGPLPREMVQMYDRPIGPRRFGYYPGRRAPEAYSSYDTLTYDLGYLDPQHYKAPNFAYNLQYLAETTVSKIAPTLNARHQDMLRTRLSKARKFGRHQGSREMSTKNAVRLAMKAEEYGLIEARKRLKTLTHDLKTSYHKLVGRRKRTAAEKEATYVLRKGRSRTTAASARVRAGALRAAANE
jgi:hypothetical protein